MKSDVKLQRFVVRGAIERAEQMILLFAQLNALAANAIAPRTVNLRNLTADFIFKVYENY